MQFRDTAELSGILAAVFGTPVLVRITFQIQ
jgi:hypothetical protein